jgi:hypothetical protein
MVVRMRLIFLGRLVLFFWHVNQGLARLGAPVASLTGGGAWAPNPRNRQVFRGVLRMDVLDGAFVSICAVVLATG